jgi:DNA repair protein RecN (Recombination protein N)
MIRNGSERAEVTAVFDISNDKKIEAWLKEETLDEAGDCILRRSLSREGRSRAFINGRPVPLQQLQTLGDLLVEIHGQHAHQSLIKKSHQRYLLDAYGGHLSQAKDTQQAHDAYQTSRKALEKLSSEAADRTSRLELLSYQQTELSSLNVTTDEIEQIDHDHKRLTHLDQLRSQCGEMVNGLDESEPSVRSLLVRYSEQLENLTEIDDSLGSAQEMLAGALIQIDESLAFLRNYLNDQELDPAALQQLEERLETIHDCARKYRVSPQQLPERLAEIEQELDQLNNADVALSSLEQQVEAERNHYLKLAKKLSQARKSTAAKLGGEISKMMQQLGMKGGEFAVNLIPLAEDEGSAQGLEQVEFQVSANPGMPLQSLSKVASGGELSRISLAIQVATIRYSTTPTLVFDEVDVGIGGGVAEVVGKLLRTLGDSRQILCVTHLPQVAAQAMSHLQVKKQSKKDQTQTSIAHLGQGDRIEEIARMLGGVKITDQTLAHAKEMVEMAASR